MQNVVSFTLNGAEVRLPEDVVRRQFLASLQAANSPMPGDTPTTCSSTLTPPALGAMWQAQGGIYAGIVRGTNGQPDHYLIVDAFADEPEQALGTYGTDVDGAKSKSDGLANTQALAAAGSDLCKALLALTRRGFSDWYLPAANEAHILAANVPELFRKEGWYWTSTQDGSFGAFVQDFENGTHSYGFTASSRRARAVRRIQLNP